jgi:hypothetical protein
MDILYLRDAAFMATNNTKVFSGYQPYQFMPHNQSIIALMLGTQMVPETLVAFNELTHLIA